jgi:hypothetical protein
VNTPAGRWSPETLLVRVFAHITRRGDAGIDPAEAQGMRVLMPVALVLAAAGCGGSSSPTSPTPVPSRLVLEAASPASGSTIAVPEQYPYIVPGGVVIPPGSGLISVRVTMTSGHDVPWAKLSVYLLRDGSNTESCGENGPDAPTWSFLTPGWTTTYTVTGFRVYRLPCEVTGVRAMLHMRNGGVFAPPTPAETIAEATLTRSVQIRQ